MKCVPPLLEAIVVRSTKIYFDRDGYFVVEFDNFVRSYAVIVALTDRNLLSISETRAIGDAVKLAARGTAVDNAIFFEQCARLRSQYSSFHGPVVENDRLVCLLEPNDFSYSASGAHVIDRLQLSFDGDCDLVITAHTQCRDTYSVVLALSGNQGALSVADCEAFRDILVNLEPGGRVDLTDFLCQLASLRESYGHLRLGKTNGAVSCMLFASKTRGDEEMPHPIQSALKVRERRLKAAQAESAAVAMQSVAHCADVRPPKKVPPGVPMYPQPQKHPVVASPVDQPVTFVQTPPSSPMPCCPYPDMVYTRALTESGQAQVYAGEKLSTGEKVAIKVFLGTGNAAGSTFRLELRMLLKMREHPNVIEVLDFFEYPRPALVTRLIEGGGDMLEHIRKHGAMAPEDAKAIAAELAEGVLHLHRSGIVHRDLKSANVLLRSKRDSCRLTPVIIDLGLGAARRGKQREAASTPANEAELAMTFAAVTLSEKTQGMKGTPFWMCPEMVRAQEWSEKTDVYAFGIILWEMLSGHQPFSHIVVRDQWDLMWRILHGERPDVGAMAHAPAQLRSIVERCWRQNPKERPTMQQVVDELRGSDPEAIFRSVDADGSNSLDFPELVGFLGRYAPETTPGEMYPIFAGLDANGSGGISLLEFKKFWTVVTHKGIHVALKECQTKGSR